MESQSAEKFILVGVDGSPCSKEALRWAAQEAALRGAVVDAVITWNIPSMAYSYPVPMVGAFDLEPESKKTVRDTISEVLGEKPAVEVRESVVEGRAGPVLVELSEGAEMLVVGSRGHGILSGYLLGSVSEYCVAHATCPVVVVHEGDQSGKDAESRALAGSAPR